MNHTPHVLVIIMSTLGLFTSCSTTHSSGEISRDLKLPREYLERLKVLFTAKTEHGFLARFD